MSSVAFAPLVTSSSPMKGTTERPERELTAAKYDAQGEKKDFIEFQQSKQRGNCMRPKSQFVFGVPSIAVLRRSKIGTSESALKPNFPLRAGSRGRLVYKDVQGYMPVSVTGFQRKNSLHSIYCLQLTSKVTVIIKWTNTRNTDKTLFYSTCYTLCKPKGAFLNTM